MESPFCSELHFNLERARFYSENFVGYNLLRRTSLGFKIDDWTINAQIVEQKLYPDGNDSILSSSVEEFFTSLKVIYFSFFII